MKLAPLRISTLLPQRRQEYGCCSCMPARLALQEHAVRVQRLKAFLWYVEVYESYSMAISHQQVRTSRHRHQPRAFG